jgi:hypothetical protein
MPELAQQGRLRGQSITIDWSLRDQPGHLLRAIVMPSARSLWRKLLRVMLRIWAASGTNRYLSRFHALVCTNRPQADVPLAALLQALKAVWDPGHTVECRQGLHGRCLPAEFSQQGFRLLQVRRGKPFCKPVIDRRQKQAGFSALALLLPEATQA